MNLFIEKNKLALLLARLNGNICVGCQRWSVRRPLVRPTPVFHPVFIYRKLSKTDP